MIKVRYPDHHNLNKVYDWCHSHCRGHFYSGTDWDTKNWVSGSKNRAFQFENEQDAVAFALVWS